jgi:hypothetical protein
MKIHKTTEECNKYNAENKSAIDCGLMEGYEPDDAMVKEEAEDKAREAAKFQKAETELDIFKMLDPNTDGAKCLGIRVKINETCSGGWNRKITGHRLKFGDWGCKRWLAIGDGAILGLTEKQKAKAIAILLELQAEYIASKKNNEEFARVAIQKTAWLKVPENEALIKDITGEEYANSSVFTLSEDSKFLIYYSEKFTIDQWQQIVTFKKQQAADLEAFKNTFKKNLT